jgi:glycosyltransferase involved in cell wall biosynthesis
MLQTKNNKLKILIGCLFFKEFTGSEMYVYELSKNLLKLNCEVHVISPNIGGPLTELGEKTGIKIHDFLNPPINQKFDIIHGQHYPVVEALIKLFPSTPKICTIHSEVISLENPIQDISIFKYIAIRPEIKEHLIKKFNILERQIEVIYNPIDENRFNNKNIKDDGYILFVGTIDFLRKKTILDLIEYSKSVNKDLWIIGKNHSDYLDYIKSQNHVKYYEDVYSVENFVKNCSETAGILLGRTTIEGWMCGKPGWIYSVDSFGNIIDKQIHPVPNDIDKFSSIKIAEKIKQLYLKIINL